MQVQWTQVPANIDSNRYAMCALCSSVVPWGARPAHEAFHDSYKHKQEITTMSGAAWCDPGNHAFKAGEPGSQSFQGTSMDDDGNPIRMEMDACAEHSFRAQTNTQAPTAIEGASRSSDD